MTSSSVDNNEFSTHDDPFEDGASAGNCPDRTRCGDCCGAREDSEPSDSETAQTATRGLAATTIADTLRTATQALTGLARRRPMTVTTAFATTSSVVLKVRWEVPILVAAANSLLLAATLAWTARTLMHLIQGRMGPAGLRVMTMLEVAVAAGWVSTTAAYWGDASPQRTLAAVAALVLATFLVAQFSEIARERVWTLHHLPEHERCGDWFSKCWPDRLITGAMLLDGLGRHVKATIERDRIWAFSGLVRHVLVIASAALVILGLQIVQLRATTRAETSTHRPAATRNRAGTSHPVATTSNTSPAAPTPIKNVDQPAPSSLMPAPTDTPTETVTQPGATQAEEHTTYQERCEAEGQLPGADDPNDGSRFTALFLGPGAYIVGCAQPTETSDNGTCRWETGTLDGDLKAVAVVNDNGDDAIFYDDTAAPVLAILESQQCVGGTDRHLVHSGDVQLMSTPSGTRAIVRETEYADGEPTTHVILSPAATKAWLETMNAQSQWLWPHPDQTAHGYSLRDTDIIDIGVTIVETGDSAAVITDHDKTTYRNGARLPWSKLAVLAA